MENYLTSARFGQCMIFLKRGFWYSISIWEDAEQGIAEIEDAKERLAG
jgi:hypothetical protein